MKKKIAILFVAVLLTTIALVLHVENCPVTTMSSSVFTTSDQTEIQMHVVLNKLTYIDKEEMAMEIISEHQKINKFQDKVVYTLCLYRTLFHFRRNWQYDTIICDENGAIICCGENLGV